MLNTVDLSVENFMPMIEPKTFTAVSEAIVRKPYRQKSSWPMNADNNNGFMLQRITKNLKSLSDQQVNSTTTRLRRYSPLVYARSPSTA